MEADIVGHKVCHLDHDPVALPYNHRRPGESPVHRENALATAQSGHVQLLHLYIQMQVRRTLLQFI